MRSNLLDDIFTIAGLNQQERQEAEAMVMLGLVGSVLTDYGVDTSKLIKPDGSLDIEKVKSVLSQRVSTKDQRFKLIKTMQEQLAKLLLEIIRDIKDKADPETKQRLEQYIKKRSQEYQQIRAEARRILSEIGVNYPSSLSDQPDKTSN